MCSFSLSLSLSFLNKQNITIIVNDPRRIPSGFLLVAEMLCMSSSRGRSRATTVWINTALGL